jgi:hypothetical protein
LRTSEAPVDGASAVVRGRSASLAQETASWPDNAHLILAAVLVVLPLVLGFAIGRWWTLIAAIAFGVWVGAEVEFDGQTDWAAGLFAGLVTGGSVSLGVLLRRFAEHLARR